MSLPVLGAPGEVSSQGILTSGKRSADPNTVQHVHVAEFVLILMAAAAIALAVKVVPVPYVSAIALAGLVAGPFLGPTPVPLTETLIPFVLLPGLLFEAAFNLSWPELRRNLVAVAVLASVGVVLTTGAVAPARSRGPGPRRSHRHLVRGDGCTNRPGGGGCCLPQAAGSRLHGQPR